MKVIVHSNETQRLELSGSAEISGITWVSTPDALVMNHDADVIVDLLFDEDPSRTGLLKSLDSKLVIINSVIATLSETDPSFVRINGWNGFLEKNIIEAAGKEENRQKAEEAFSLFDKTITWLPDHAGFISARVISMIINEAFLAIHEQVSTKEQVNTAMKLGTNYPLGPFEWAEKIGAGRIRDLLLRLAKDQPKYAPSANLG
jgi:3-hydroxybutyryl-CoA dehydrogenase